MYRNVVGALLASVLFATLVPLPAQALATLGSARIVAGATVHPGLARHVQVQVSNTEPVLLSPQINHVRVRLPAGLVTYPSTQQGLPGWSLVIDRSGPGEEAIFSGGSIPPGESATFPLTVDVGRPERSDRSVQVVVLTSSDGGATTQEAPPAGPGDLTIRVRILEIAVTQPLTGPQAPDGVLDGTATAGQEIVYGFSVRNHALEALAVTGELLTTDSRDSAGPPQTRTLGGGDAWTLFTFSASLGPAGGTSRDAGFVLVAESAEAWNSRQGPQVRVQSPATLEFVSIEPTHVRSGQPVDVHVVVRKSGAPSLTLTSVRLTSDDGAYTLAEPFVISAQTGNRVLTFQGVTFSGPDRTVSLRLDASGHDSNEASFAFGGIAGSVTVDDTPPSITLGFTYPTDPYGKRQVAVKSGDPVAVSCSSAEPVLIVAWIVPNVGTPASAACNGVVYPGYEPGADRLDIIASATDKAGNIGSASVGPVTIDNSPPRIVGARIISPTTIRVEVHDRTPVRGGCDPLQWSIDGVRVLTVREVLLENGARCSGSGAVTPAPSPETVRVLVLNQAVEAGATVQVGYHRCVVLTARCGDNMVDGAGHDLPTSTVQATWQ